MKRIRVYYVVFQKHVLMLRLYLIKLKKEFIKVHVVKLTRGLIAPGAIYSFVT